MKLVTFSRGTAAPATGALLDGDALLDFTHEACNLPQAGGPYDWFDLDSASHQAAARLTAGIADRRASLESAGAVCPRAEARLHAPVPRPRKVICIGLNYRDHAEESGMAIPELPLVFSKFSTSVIGPEEQVVIPEGSVEVDYEAEFGVVIGRVTKNVSVDEAMSGVLGYTCVNDVSSRDFQFADGQWQRGKSPDTFCPMGEFIATTDEIPDPHDLRIALHLNGETLQDSSTNQLIFGIPQVVAHLSKTTTLEPGDLIATGTPPGVGFARKPPIYIKSGDVMVVEIEGLGQLRNPVA